MTSTSSIRNESLKQILAGVGGKNNIKLVTHCITRLRFVLHDESLINKTAIEGLAFACW